MLKEDIVIGQTYIVTIIGYRGYTFCVQVSDSGTFYGSVLNSRNILLHDHCFMNYSLRPPKNYIETDKIKLHKEKLMIWS